MHDAGPSPADAVPRLRDPSCMRMNGMPSWTSAVSTGAKQTSVPSSRLGHSSQVFVLKIAARYDAAGEFRQGLAVVHRQRCAAHVQQLFYPFSGEEFLFHFVQVVGTTS